MASRDVTLKIVVEAVNATAKHLQEVVNSLREVKKEANEVGASSKQSGEEGRKGFLRLGEGADKAKKSVSDLNQLATEFKSIGFQLLGLGAALSAAAFFPVKEAASFEKAMSGVLAVTSGAEELFGDLTKKAQEMGMTSIYSATQVAEGMRLLGLAGLDASQVLEAIGPTLKLATVGELEVAEAAGVAAATLFGMNLQVKDLDHVMDVLATTATSTYTDVHQLGEAMKYAAPAAAALGVKVDTLGALIGVLGSNGIQANMAGTTLRGMMIALASPTAKAQKAFAKLGTDIAHFADGSIDLLGTLENLKRAHMGLAEATDIFRRWSATGTLAVTNQIEWVRELTKANEENIGSAQKMSDIILNNLVGALLKAKAAATGLLIALGEPLLKALTSVTTYFVKILNFATEMVTKFPVLTGVLVGTAGAVGLLLTGLGSLLIIAGSITKAIVSINSVIILLQGHLTVLGVLLTALQTIGIVAIIAAATTAVVGAVVAFNKWRDAVADNIAVSKEWAKEKEKLAHASNLEARSMDELKSMTYDQVKAYKDSAVEAMKYYGAAKNEALLAGKNTDEYNDKLVESIIMVKRASKVISETTNENIKNIKSQAQIRYETLQQEQIYYRSMRTEALLAGEDAMQYELMLSKIGEEMTELSKTLAKVKPDSVNELKEAIKATQEEIKNFEKTAKKAYTAATEEAEKYAKKVEEFNEKIKFSNLDTEDKLRELKRKTLNELGKWDDEKLQAEEKISAARTALANKDYELAEKLAKQAETLYAGLATTVEEEISKMGVKRVENEEKRSRAVRAIQQGDFAYAKTLLTELGDYQTDVSNKMQESFDKNSKITVKSLESTIKVAERGVEDVGRVLEAIYTEQRDLALDSKNKFTDIANEIKKSLDEIAEKRTAKIDIKLDNLLAVQDAINELTKDDTKIVRIKVVEEKAIGGPVGAVTQSGKLPGGDSRKDSVHVLARPGEWFIKNEAVQHWTSRFGAGFMHGINNPMSGLGKTIRSLLDPVQKFASGGEVKDALLSKFYAGIPAMAGGGKLPGDSKKDSLLVRARPGEWFVRNESGKFWNSKIGSWFMEGVNNPLSNFGKRISEALSNSMPSFNLGGLVGSHPSLSFPGYGTGGSVYSDKRVKAKDMGTLILNFNNKSYPIQGDVDVLNEFKQALIKESLTRSN